MLKLLLLMGRCTEAEIEHYSSEFRQRVTRESEEYRKGSGRPFTEVWQNCQARWLSYPDLRPGRSVPCLKLAKGQSAVAEQLLQKHGLTPEGIKQAHTLKKEQERREYEERQRQHDQKEPK
jgi:hypothetical protein